MIPVAIAPVIEHIGDVYVISAVAKKDFISDSCPKQSDAAGAQARRSDTLLHFHEIPPAVAVPIGLPAPDDDRISEGDFSGSARFGSH